MSRRKSKKEEYYDLWDPELADLLFEWELEISELFSDLPDCVLNLGDFDFGLDDESQSTDD